METIADGLTPVQSSNIQAVGFEGGTLTIAFKGGATYEYGPCEHAVYAALLGAPSKGKFFWSQVRGKYPYRKVEVQA